MHAGVVSATMSLINAQIVTIVSYYILRIRHAEYEIASIP